MRRIFVATAELPKLPQAEARCSTTPYSNWGCLTVMVVVLVAALIMLQRQTKQRQENPS
jgi:type II secretory pathway component PulF